MATGDYKDHKKGFVTFRISREERAVLGQYAKSKGLTTNEFLYSLVKPILQKYICECGREKVINKNACNVCEAIKNYNKLHKKGKK